MNTRRRFISSMAAATAMTAARFSWSKRQPLTRKERVDRALRGEEVDRPPFTFWRHYNRSNAQLEAQDHLDLHRHFGTDIVKVMNDFDYPKSKTGKWYELDTLDSPYPQQLDTLKRVRDGLNGDAYFIDTVYGPYMTAQILFFAEPQFAGLKSEDDSRVVNALRTFQQEHTTEWEQAVEAITQSTINHIKASQQLGSSGTLLSLMNTTSKAGSVENYVRYSRPYDKRIADTLAGTKLSVLHLHFLERPFLAQFQDFRAPVINYSVKTSGIPISEVRGLYSQAIAGGVDEIDFGKLTSQDIRRQWTEARAQAGNKFIITPGCSLPDESTEADLTRMMHAVTSPPTRAA